MRYTYLGRTALKVSQVCLGTLNLGVRAGEDESRTLLDTALDHGINFLDTANQYGWQKHKGYTEELLGTWFAQGGGRREKVVLATKAGNPMDDWPNESGLSARHLIASCEASLRRLGTDWIDVYQMHHVDRHAPWDEIWQAMDVLVQQGKIRYVGSSNFAGWHLAEAQETAHRRHTLGLVSEQSIYNLITRHIELEVIPAAQRYGIAVIAWSPLHGGLLSGALRKLADNTAQKTAQGRAAQALTIHHDTIAAYEKLCTSLGTDPAEVALAWVASRPGITAPAIGPRTVAQLESALSALELTLSPDTVGELDRLFPPIGNGGPGPEAWAW
ncbi:aldo/keto reductase [Streptomyces albus]|uniref:Aldo/keto reductase n=1 Tax=Streptomyces albus (strain ATCC 21838 / DSM 41398 / FERM P-419 / JCM 4703 / NBRC 107858) TaxID=1081613 RepID=A0A0B5F7Z3_STRA4|nr:aldo/keto reductase [Streptomyces albus]